MRVRCYLLLGGLSPGPGLLSGFDRLSAPDRRSPTSCFSAFDRVSVPDRRSFEVRLPSPDRFSSLPIVVSVGFPRIMLDRAGLSHDRALLSGIRFSRLPIGPHVGAAPAFNYFKLDSVHRGPGPQNCAASECSKAGCHPVLCGGVPIILISASSKF